MTAFPVRRIPLRFLLLTLLGTVVSSLAAADFDGFLKPLLAENCTRCHGGEKTKGKVNLKEITSAEQFLGKPELIKEMIEVVDAYDMPPEDEPELEEGERTQLLATLKTMLREAASSGEVKPVQIRRLNRFQYNNAVKDLFQLKGDVFALREKLMTRQGNYLVSGAGKMPDKVDVSCQSLNPKGGMKEVNAFPVDLRAAHGFDNQANQLTLSPLLLDAFLKLSVSIVDSPDFNGETVGIWDEFFKEPPAGTNIPAEVRTRLVRFLWLAFRGPVDGATIDRYIAYTLSKMKAGLSFTDSMKKVASAALSSPLFLYRYAPENEGEAPFELASNLSFFLWGSSPDFELLRLANTGELTRPNVLDQTIARMVADPKVERFLDSFPSQWMQLENALAATPDPKLARLFSIDRDNPASTQMVLEPLLLFDAVFVEDRPISELIAPAFSYQSEFLKTWYHSDLRPPKFDPEKIAAENRSKDAKRKFLQASITKTRSEWDALVEPVKARILAERQKGAAAKNPVDLKPYASWEFDGNLNDSSGSLELKAHGKIQYENGLVVLDKSYLQSANLPMDLKAKTLEVWIKVPDINQRGGGVMGIQGPGDFFDTIVLGERKPLHWISGSNGFSRTEDFPDSTPEEKPDETLHLVMVYQEDGTTSLYRNGQPYGKPYRKGAATFPKDQSSVIFGLRHLPAGGNKFLNVRIDKAHFYDRALTEAEVAASSSGIHYVSDKDLSLALTPDQREKKDSLADSLEHSESALNNIPPNQDPNEVKKNIQNAFDEEIRHRLRSQTFERVAASDPRYGGVITNAAMLSMTSGPTRTHPIARGAWLIEVIFNDPPPPPPNNVPPLDEDGGDKNLTIREKFATHRENPDCAGCHSRLDPLGFALENFDITGRWRDKYDNGRDVDSSGTLMKKYEFESVVEFKQSLIKEQKRFAKAFTAHLLRFYLARELAPSDSLTVEAIVDEAGDDEFKLRTLIREVILSDPVLRESE